MSAAATIDTSQWSIYCRGCGETRPWSERDDHTCPNPVKLDDALDILVGPTVTEVIGEVEVTARLWGSADKGGVTVEVRCLPGYRWWTCPDATRLRRIVDKALKDTGRVRDGARLAHNDGPLHIWRFTYYTKEVVA